MDHVIVSNIENERCNESYIDDIVACWADIWRLETIGALGILEVSWYLAGQTVDSKNTISSKLKKKNLVRTKYFSYPYVETYHFFTRKNGSDCSGPLISMDYISRTRSKFYEVLTPFERAQKDLSIDVWLSIFFYSTCDVIFVRITDDRQSRSAPFVFSCHKYNMLEVRRNKYVMRKNLKLSP